MGNLHAQKLPVYAVMNLVTHPIQDVLYNRLTHERGAFLFAGPFGSGKHHYMLEAAHRLNESGRQVYWVDCGSMRGRDECNVASKISRVIGYGDVKDMDDLLIKTRALTRPTTFFFSGMHLSLLLDTKVLDAALYIANSGPSVIFASSRPEECKMILERGDAQLLCEPILGRWDKSHFLQFIEKNSVSRRWDPERKERYAEILALSGTADDAAMIVHSCLGEEQLANNMRLMGLRWDKFSGLSK